MEAEIQKRVCYQLNPLVEAQKKFDVMESRIFYLGLQEINPHLSNNDKFYDDAFHEVQIPPMQLKNIFGNGKYLQEVKDTAFRLLGRYVSIFYEGGFAGYTIFDYIRYENGKGLFFKFSEQMRPFILDIYKSYHKYGFTKIQMQQVFILSSTYAMRLLELLLQYRGKAKKNIIEREIKVDDLRKMLNVPDDAYPRIDNFKKRVLDNPIKEINKKTSYVVSYETVKEGRKVVAFCFFCNCSNVAEDGEYTDTVETAAAASPAPVPAAQVGSGLFSAEDKKAFIKERYLSAGLKLVHFNADMKLYRKNGWSIDDFFESFMIGAEEAEHAKNPVAAIRAAVLKNYALNRRTNEEIKEREERLAAEKKQIQKNSDNFFAGFFSNPEPSINDDAPASVPDVPETPAAESEKEEKPLELTEEEKLERQKNVKEKIASWKMKTAFEQKENEVPKQIIDNLIFRAAADCIDHDNHVSEETKRAIEKAGFDAKTFLEEKEENILNFADIIRAHEQSGN